MEYIKLTKDNIETEHICCAISNNNDVQVSSKKAWLKERIEDELHLPVKEYWIGPIVGISCGPGMYGVYFKGKLVTADSENPKK